MNLLDQVWAGMNTKTRQSFALIFKRDAEDELQTLIDSIVGESAVWAAWMNEEDMDSDEEHGVTEWTYHMITFNENAEQLLKEAGIRIDDYFTFEVYRDPDTGQWIPLEE